MHGFVASIVTVTLLAGTTVTVGAQADPTSRPAIPSGGCGGAVVEPGIADGSLDIQGAERIYTLYVPEAHDGALPRPLWVQLHGGGETGSSHASKLKATAQMHGFVVAAPNADVGNAGWAWREDDPALDTSMSNEDIALVDALLDRLADELCIDLARVYVAGYSAGGEGASVLGCVLEDRFAAVAPVAGMLDVGDACELDRPVPFIAVHATGDELAYFDGGYSYGYNDFPVVQAHGQTSIPERVTNVALRNGCRPEPTVEPIEGRVARWAWDCPPGAETELIVIDGGRHAWPVAPFGYDAAGWIWEFFEQHPMPE